METLQQAWLITDGILLSYQVPVVGVNAQGRRLKISGVKLTGHLYRQLLLVARLTAPFTLNFGHTSVSLATAKLHNQSKTCCTAARTYTSCYSSAGSQYSGVAIQLCSYISEPCM